MWRLRTSGSLSCTTRQLHFQFLGFLIFLACHSRKQATKPWKVFAPANSPTRFWITSSKIQWRVLRRCWSWSFSMKRICLCRKCDLRILSFRRRCSSFIEPWIGYLRVKWCSPSRPGSIRPPSPLSASTTSFSAFQRKQILTYATKQSPCWIRAMNLHSMKRWRD